MSNRKSGNYSVPPEVRALKPKGIRCIVKKLSRGYYVYEYLRVDDPKNPGHKKNATGKYLGVIANGRFCPVDGGIADIMDEDPDNLDYGEYAVAIACSKNLLSLLENVYSYNDSSKIYVIALICFANGFTPARDLCEYYIQSYLCKKYAHVFLSENTVGKFFKLLGNHSRRRKEFEQLLIDDGSGSYNIDGHVILCCSDNNALADYGSKYKELGDTQTNFMVVYDVGKKRPVACEAVEGGLPDSSAVRDTLRSHKFENSRFRVDSGFYSEDNLGLFRANTCKYIIPVPGSTNLKKTAHKHIHFSGSFIHKRINSHGEVEYSLVQYQEYTVEELEKLAEQDAKAEADAFNAEAKKMLQPGEEFKEKAPRKISHSLYPADRVVVYRDQLMHDRCVFEYRCHMGDGKHTEEKLAELEPFFGIILLRTNDLNITAKALYIEYKDRWPPETFFDYVRNGAHFNALHTQNYYVQQAIGFLLVVEGLIYAGVEQMIKDARMPYLHNMSVNELKLTAGRLKICQHADNTWHANTVKGKIKSLFEVCGVNVQDDLKALNS